MSHSAQFSSSVFCFLSHSELKTQISSNIEGLTCSICSCWCWKSSAVIPSYHLKVQILYNFQCFLNIMVQLLNETSFKLYTGQLWGAVTELRYLRPAPGGIRGASQMIGRCQQAVAGASNSQFMSKTIQKHKLFQLSVRRSGYCLIAQ